MTGGRNSASAHRHEQRISNDEPTPLLLPETAQGDLGLADVHTSSGSAAAHRPPSRLSIELPDLELPEPALPTPIVAYPPKPQLRDGVEPTRKDFATLSPPPTVPLRPILNPESRFTSDVASPPAGELHLARSISPTFAPRADDEPHPERGIHDDRVLHPLYTPARKRTRTRSRKARSTTSGRSGKSNRSVKTHLRTLFRFLKGHPTDKRRISRLSLATSATGSSRSSSSSSSSTSDHSSRSSSTWAGWRFWRNSSSGSSTSGRDESDTDDEFEPPQPMFTLLTPYLGQQEALAYPEHLLPRSEGLTPAPTAGLSKQRVFDLASSVEIGPALQRLQAFWSERMQEDTLVGDLGESVMPAMEQDDDSSGRVQDEAQQDYFSRLAVASNPRNKHLTIDASVLAPTPVASPIDERPPQDPVKNSTRILRGVERALRAEQRRLGKKGSEEQTGPAWWLDIMCPSVADLKELRKVLPLHPLTMEDIMHQETREKIEAFPALGYYFIIFRALDESYFKYHSPEPTAAPDQTPGSAQQDNASGMTESTMNGAVPSRAGRVEIVEGVGGKEGIEGVGVGAINMYLIVFDDGILSFHFEDLSKHIEHVQGRLQSFGAPQSISSHWIAYGLMDSVVDAFFPLINFIEAESQELGKFLADPLRPVDSPHDNRAFEELSQRKRRKRAKAEEAAQAVVEVKVQSQSDFDEKSAGEAHDSKPPASRLSRLLSYRTPSVSDLRRFFTSHFRRPKKLAVSEDSMSISGKRPKKERKGLDPRILFRREMVLIAETTSDRAELLRRIVDSRKLVTALSRLLWSKTEVVRGLRKRTKEDHIRLFRGSTKYDIGIYLGDLIDHILAMQQSLTFYDAILANDHPAYAGLLRLSSRSAKHDIDKTLVKLSMVTITFLVMNVLPGVFTLNIGQPTNGARGTHLEADGVTLAPFNLFGIILSAEMVLATLTWVYFYFSFRTARRHRRVIAPALQY